MLFLNIGLLLGLLGISIPILIHLFHRRAVKNVEWGAMQFLYDSLVRRRRRILLEEILLLACRCLLLACLALAVARPFITPGSGVPWLVVLPMLLFGTVTLGCSFAAWQYRTWRRWLTVAALGMFLAAGLSVILERWLNLKRFGRGGDRDVVLIVDGSDSMKVRVDGQPNFERAVAEAQKLVDRSGRRLAFGLLLGGQIPSGKLPAPVADHRTVLAALDGLAPSGGSFNVLDALAMASVSLAQGYNTSKQIVIFTDGHATAWDTDRPARWQFVADMFRALPTPPQIILRRLPLPPLARNLAVTSVTLSRDVVGIDREAGVVVEIRNTGSEAVTPTEVTLELDGKTQTDRTTGQVDPGEAVSVRFVHQFAQPGSHVLRTTVVVDDELADDNVAERVACVVDRLPVLIVNGSPGLTALDGGGAFAAIALAPGRRTVPAGVPPGGAAAPAPFEHYLVEPELVDAAALVTLPDLERFAVLVLADVPRLPAAVARRVERFAQQGGGVLLAPGAGADAGFYNTWTTDAGQPFPPARLAGHVVTNDAAHPVVPALNTFRHRALKLVADRAHSDLDGTVLTAYWRLGESATDAAVHVGGRLNTGDPFVVERRLGKGTIVQLCCPLDARGGNLPARQSFVPLLHELVYYLALPGGVNLNLSPAEGLSLRMTGSLGVQTGSGLSAGYYEGRTFDKLVLARVEPRIEMNAGDGSPAPGVPRDNFRVRWVGSFVPRFTETYTLEASADDWMNVWVDGKAAITRGGRTTLALQAGRRYDLRVEYGEDVGQAGCQLIWQSPSQTREVIPASQLSPLRGPSAEKLGAPVSALGPDGVERPGMARSGDEGLSIGFRGDVVPGLYHMKAPGEGMALLAPLRGPDGSVPFSVARDGRESRFAPLTQDDLALVGKYVTLVDADSLDRVRQALQGKAFGQELWKPLAVALFLLLIAEIALSRWIAGQRKTGEHRDVEFEERTGPSAAFRRQLDRVRGWGRPGPDKAGPAST